MAEFTEYSQREESGNNIESIIEKKEECANYDFFDGMKKIGKEHKHFFLIGSACYFFDMMDMNLFGQVAASVQASFNLTLDQMGIFNSLSFWGMFFGGILAGFLSQKFGRKPITLAFMTIFSLGSLGNALISNFLFFAFCRFLVGFGITGMNIVVMVYIAEMMPASSRGKYQGLMAGIGSLGLPVLAVLSAAIIPRSPEAWRFMFIIGSLGLVLIPVGMKWMYESPRWLAGCGKTREAEKIVSKITGLKSDLSDYAIRCRSFGQTSVIETLKFFGQNKQLGLTILLMTIAVGGIVGGFFLANWKVNLLHTMGFNLQIILLVMMLAMLGSPLGDFISAVVSDKGGRKYPMGIAFVLSAVCAVISGVVVGPKSGTIALIIWGIIQLIMTASIVAGNTMYWTYLAENLPTRFRSQASGLIMSTSRVVIAIVTPLVPIIYGAKGMFGGWFNINCVNAIFFIIPAVAVLAFGPKSAQMTLEEIEDR